MEIKKTALYATHYEAGAKLVEFAGYWMPIQYRGIFDEHRKVRNSVGLFDVSHMGEFKISGPNALEFLQKVTINDVSKLAEYQIQYSAMCYEDGGIVDDLLVYRLPDYYLTVVNAANIGKDFEWMEQNLIPGANLENLSDQYSLIAIQGPNSLKTLQKLTSTKLDDIPYYWCTAGTVADAQVLLSRTGYTGEIGFEIAVSPDKTARVWESLMQAGAEYDIEPVGLAARDTLRLEMKYCLYGNDIDATTNPLEAGLGWITKLKKGDFIGREKLLEIKQNGVSRKLVGIVTEGRAIPRHGYSIYSGDQKIGVVTSGTMSPMLEKGICMAYVDKEFSNISTSLEIEIRNRRIAAQVVETPFYKPQS